MKSLGPVFDRKLVPRAGKQLAGSLSYSVNYPLCLVLRELAVGRRQQSESIRVVLNIY